MHAGWPFVLSFEFYKLCLRGVLSISSARALYLLGVFLIWSVRTLVFYVPGLSRCIWADAANAFFSSSRGCCFFCSRLCGALQYRILL